MKYKNINKKGLLCATAFVALIGLNSAAAQSIVMEEVMVTAQKREQNLQSVGISITAISGSQMSALGLDNTQDITQQIPGLQMQTFTPGLTIFNLRGISQNNFQDNLEAPVAAYIDDVYIGSMNAIGGQMYDMERVEVLRGPQGTLFGRNATGGLIHFVTKKATDDEFNGYMKLEVSEFGSYNLEAAVGGALSDKIRARLSGRWEHSDGYSKPGPILPDALAPGSPAIGGDGIDSLGANGFGLRGNVQMDAGDNTTLDFTASYSKDNDVPVGQYAVYLTGIDGNGLGQEIDASNPVTGDVYRHAGSDVSVGGRDTGLDREMVSLTGKITTEFSNGMEFVSITNWFDMFKSHREDVGGGVVEFPFTSEADYQQWSQEFRLSGDGERYRWQVGFYYLSMKLKSEAPVGGPIITGFPEGIIDASAKVNSTNWSIFAQTEYDITDSLTVIGGFRWSQDNKKITFQNTARSGMGSIPDGTVLFDLAEVAVGEFSDVPKINYGDYAARLQLNWQANEDTLLFLSYNRGIKGGNWSPSSQVTIENFKHKEETLHAYEVGVKASLADGMARVNATVFYYDYKDYQAFSLFNFIPQVTNSDATSKGGEIEVFTSPTDNVDIILGLSYIDSKIKESPGAFPGSLIIDAEFPNAPRVSLNYLLRYNHDALGGNIAFQVDGVYNDQQFLEGHNGGSSIQDSYGNVNASINYTSGEEDWSLRLWAKNLTNTENAIYSLDIGGFVIRQYAPPRWFGATISYNW